MASARRMCARDCNVCNFLWQMGGHLLGRWASVRGVILLTTAGSHSVQLPRLSGGWEQIFNICTRDLRLGAKSAPARSRNCKAKYLWFRLPETTNVHKTPPQNSLSNSSRSDASSWARHTCANISRLQLSPMVVILLFTTESISSAGKRNEIDLSPFLFSVVEARGLSGSDFTSCLPRKSLWSSVTQAITWTPGLLTCEPAKDTRNRPSSSRNSLRLTKARKRKLIVRNYQP